MTAPARWWAPAEPGIGPDELDLFLLSANGDPERDLGQVLLGLHRVGAAACEAVASQPLSDEELLRTVLAKARELVAPEASEPVAKCLGDVNYGNLLLRDLLDDAEAAAVSLYRTCLAGGVAPTLAAQRVGKVYGTPIHELGRYTALARDPKAQPVALDDVADRTLLGYVSKVVSEEAPAGEKITFSKAPEEGGYLERHNETQDARGRFARLRGTVFGQPETEQRGTTAPGQITPEQATTVGPAQRRQATARTSQATRRAQASRRAQAAAPAERSSAEARSSVERSSAERSGATRSHSARSMRTRDFLDRQEAYARSNREEPPLDTLDIPIGERDVPDPWIRHPEMDGVEPLGTHVAYSLPYEEWRLFKAKAKLLDKSIGFRAGALHEFAGGPEIYDVEEGDHPRHEEKVQARADMLYARDAADKIAPYVLSYLPVSEVKGSPEQRAARIDEAKRDFLLELQDRGNQRINVSSEMQFVYAVDDYSDESQMVLVYTPPTPGRHPLDRPVREVYDLIVPRGTAYGIDHYAGNKPGRETYELDPNMPMRHDPKHDVSRFFKVEKGGKTGYFRNEAYLRPGYDADIDNAQRRRDRKPSFGPGLQYREEGRNPFGKAEESQSQERRIRFARLVSEGLVQRDAETGEFTETATRSQASARTQAAGRRQANTRTQAQLRANPQRAALERSSSERSQGERSSEERSSIFRSAAERDQAARDVVETSDPGNATYRYTYLQPGYDYSVIGKNERPVFDNARSQSIWERGRDEATFLMTRDLVRTLNTKDKVVDQQGAAFSLMDQQDVSWTGLKKLRGEGDWRPIGGGTYTVNDPEGVTFVAQQLADYLEQVPDAGVLRLVPVSDEDGWTIRIERNKEPMTPQILIRYEDSMLDGPLELRDEGDSRLVTVGGLERWLQARYQGFLQGGRFGVGSPDQFPVPLVKTYAAHLST